MDQQENIDNIIIYRTGGYYMENVYSKEVGPTGKKWYGMLFLCILLRLAIVPQLLESPLLIEE